MAKVPFSKLQASVNNAVSHASYSNKAGEEIVYEVKQYLPLEEKVILVSAIINNSVDDNGFYNPMRVKMFMTLETVFAYTNLSFTEKMKEDLFKLYDIFVSTGIFNDVIAAMGEKEWTEIQESVWSTIKNIYEYKNSAMGILDAVSSDYNNMNLDATNIQAALGDSENLGLLRDIMTKLG
jgi:hypothetical protein